MAHDLKANLDANNPFDKLKTKLNNKNGIHTPTISKPFITEPTAEPPQPITDAAAISSIEQQAPNEARTKPEKSTTKGLKKDFTRHTFEIKKDTLTLLQALARYKNIKIADAVNDLLDYALDNIDSETKQKALAKDNGGRIKLI